MTWRRDRPKTQMDSNKLIIYGPITRFSTSPFEWIHTSQCQEQECTASNALLKSKASSVSRLFITISYVSDKQHVASFFIAYYWCFSHTDRCQRHKWTFCSWGTVLTLICILMPCYLFFRHLMKISIEERLDAFCSGQSQKFYISDCSLRAYG